MPMFFILLLAIGSFSYAMSGAAKGAGSQDTQSSSSYSLRVSHPTIPESPKAKRTRISISGEISRKQLDAIGAYLNSILCDPKNGIALTSVDYDADEHLEQITQMYVDDMRATGVVCIIIDTPRPGLQWISTNRARITKILQAEKANAHESDTEEIFEFEDEPTSCPPQDQSGHPEDQKNEVRPTSSMPDQSYHTARVQPYSTSSETKMLLQLLDQGGSDLSSQFAAAGVLFQPRISNNSK